jgi:SAM-dependent methyltransferase
MSINKSAVFEFWNNASCGEELYLFDSNIEGYREQARLRYKLEPFIESFAKFSSTRNQKVLEVGIGLGADHQRFADAGANLYGIDLTKRAIEHTKHRLKLFENTSNIQVGDAEALPFPDNYFNIVYSWGVMHHSPNTQQCINEAYRVLVDGGVARIMVYNKWSIVGLMLWTRYALLAGRPFTSLKTIYASYLESPGTKAYTLSEARDLFYMFRQVSIKTVLTHGDLLTSDAGQRHRGLILKVAKFIWPRWLIKRILPNNGLFMLIRGYK